MALRLPGDIDFDLSKAKLQGVQLALSLEQLGKLRKERETSEQESAIATDSVVTTPVLGSMGDMSVNLGNKKVFDPEQYVSGLETSGNPALLEKAQVYRKSFADIASTREKTRTDKLKNDLEDSLNNLTTMQTALDLADDDPEMAAKFFTQSNIDMGDDKESAQQITPLGNNKYEFIGTDSQGKPVRQVIDRARLVETRADANTRYTQMMESQRSADRIAADKDKEKDKTAGADYTDTKFGRMKRSDLVSEYTKLHPELDDQNFKILEIRASAKDADPTVKAEYEKQKEARANAYGDFVKWASNIYEADMTGFIHGKGPTAWMGDKPPPAWLMRGKVMKDNTTGKWKISDGSSWTDPSPEQQKEIEKKLGK